MASNIHQLCELIKDQSKQTSSRTDASSAINVNDITSVFGEISSRLSSNLSEGVIYAPVAENDSNCSKKNRSKMESALDDLSKCPPIYQVTMGGISGWLGGFLMGKIGKVVLFAIGGSVIILYVAQSQGLIQINWKAVEKKMSKTSEKLRNTIKDGTPTFIDTIKEISRKYVYLSSSFAFGYLLGLCS